MKVWQEWKMKAENAESRVKELDKVLTLASVKHSRDCTCITELEEENCNLKAQLKHMEQAVQSALKTVKHEAAAVIERVNQLEEMFEFEG